MRQQILRGSLPALVLACALLALPGAADAQSIQFTQAFSPSTIGPGSTSALVYSFANSGSSVRSFSLTDSLPAGMTVAVGGGSTTCFNGSVDATAGGSTVTFSGSGGLAGGSNCTATVYVTASAPATYTNPAGPLTEDGSTGNSSSAVLTVSTNRPGFAKSFSPSLVAFGGRSRLTFTIDNSASSVQMFNMSFTDNLPSGMTVASPANATKTCGTGTLTATAGSSTISYGPSGGLSATVNANSTCTLAVDVVGGAVGTLANVSGGLTSIPLTGGPARESGLAADSLSVIVDTLSLDKAFIGDPVAPGGTVTLQYTLTNLDRGSTATSISFTDDLDAALSGLAATSTPVSSACGAGSLLSGTDTLTLTGGSLASGASCTFSVTLQVPAGAAAGEYPSTTSLVSGSLGGRSADGLPASDDLFVAPVPVLTKTFLADPIGAGSTVELELTLTNTSPDEAATDLAFSDELTFVVPSAASVPAGGFCGAGSIFAFSPRGPFNPSTIFVSGASLPAGGSCTFSVVLNTEPDARTGDYPNVTSEVTGTVGGTEVTGSPASDDLTVYGAPVLSKEFIDDPVRAGETVTLRFTLTNDELQPGSATDISFSDDLDAALSGLTAVGLPAADVCGAGSELSGTSTLLLTGGNLGVDDTCTFDVTLQVPAGAAPRKYTNTTSAVSAVVAGVSALGGSASASLQLAGLEVTKEFIDDPVIAGGTVTLRFTLENVTTDQSATSISFTDDLDQELSGLAATGPIGDPCGTGSNLVVLQSNTFLALTDGNLAAGTSCTFDVPLQVPAGSADGVYFNSTSQVTANIGGELVTVDPATDSLTVSSQALMLTKEFTDDPVRPGQTVTLELTVTNLSATDGITDIAFTDDLDAALSGLVNAGGTLTAVCGAGSQIGGTSVLSFTGGSLPAGGSCTFSVMLSVPSTVSLGATAVNTTSAVSGNLGGLAVTGQPASDTLEIDYLAFSKSFSGAAEAGGSVGLTFTIENLSASTSVSGLSFSDDLSSVLTGLSASGLPTTGVCGTGSEISGSSFLTLSGGSLLPGASCSFTVTLQVPAGATPGVYMNATSDLFQGGLPAAAPATASLVVVDPQPQDSDGDGVIDSLDECPGTVIPEGVPTEELKPNRYALVDGDLVFDTVPPNGNGGGSQEVFTTTDTRGCSCEQIIDALGLGKGHEKFGCSVGEMREWVTFVNSGVLLR